MPAAAAATGRRRDRTRALMKSSSTAGRGSFMIRDNSVLGGSLRDESMREGSIRDGSMKDLSASSGSSRRRPQGSSSSLQFSNKRESSRTLGLKLSPQTKTDGLFRMPEKGRSGNEKWRWPKLPFFNSANTQK